MKVFIAWSGERAKAMAAALHEWLPNVLQVVRPWFSDEDIAGGAFWSPTIIEALESSRFGVACVTLDNLQSPWMSFEAGAMAARLKGRVCPYLLDLKNSGLRPTPLTQLQGVAADKAGTLHLVRSIAEAAGQDQIDVPDETKLRAAFDKWWPDLEEAFGAIPGSVEAPPPRDTAWYVEQTYALVQRLDAARGPLPGSLAWGLAQDAKRLRADAEAAVTQRIQEMSRTRPGARDRTGAGYIPGLSR